MFAMWKRHGREDDVKGSLLGGYDEACVHTCIEVLCHDIVCEDSQTAALHTRRRQWGTRRGAALNALNALICKN